MGDAFLGYLKDNQVSGWAILIIGGGTVVAAIITALQALTVAFINAKASRRLAMDTAHRSHRERLADPVLKHARNTLVVAGNVSSVLLLRRLGLQEKPNALEEAFTGFVASLRERFPFMPPTGDPPFDLAIAQMQATEEALVVNLTARPITAERLQDLEAIADHFREVAINVELAAEGYVFGHRTSRRRAVKRMAKVPEWLQKILQTRAVAG